MKKARVLVIALEEHRQVQMVNDLGRVVRAGHEALLLRRDSAGWPDLPRGVRVFDTSVKYPATWPAVVLAADPRALILKAARRQRSVRPAPWWNRVRRTAAVQAALPQLDWAVVQRHYLKAISPQTLTQIIPTTAAAWPVAWHLVRLSPLADIRSGLDREALSDAPVDAE